MTVFKIAEGKINLKINETHTNHNRSRPLVGCASTKSLNLSTVSIGMDKQEVVSLQGEPFRVAAMDGSEYFIYRGLDKELFKPNGFMVYEAFIRFKDGKVDAYGRLDDFDLSLIHI